MTLRPLPIHPWPVTPFPLPEGVVPVQALPGSHGTILALGERPGWFCDAAVVGSPAGVPTAIEVILSGKPDPRIHTAAQWLGELIPGARELSEYEVAMETFNV